MGRSRDRRIGGRGDLLVGASTTTSTSQEVSPAPVREYLSAQQLSEVTPWSTSAIEKMVARGVLVRDVHYFQPFGHRSQLIYKFSAVAELIEGPSTDGTTSLARKPLPSRGGVAAAEAGLRGLLRR